MIKTRLVGLLSHAKKYIVYTILWQWAALLSQVLAVFYHRRFTGTGSVPGSNRTDHGADDTDFSSGCGDPIYL